LVAGWPERHERQALVTDNSRTSRTSTRVCEGDTVVDLRYGPPGYEERWWGRCAECGQVVAVDFQGESEWPAFHTVEEVTDD
jgi:hypothetical protein